MSVFPRGWMWLLLSAVLTACVATPPGVGSTEEGCEAAREAADFEKACAHESSLLALCDAEHCALYRCIEVAEHPLSGRVVRTFRSSGTIPGSQGSTPQRYWGNAQRSSLNARPVLLISWGKTPLEVEEHRRIHRGANGGPWNEAWRQYRAAHRNAKKMEIELYAGQLIHEFGLYGVVVPYRQQLLQLPTADGD